MNTEKAKLLVSVGRAHYSQLHLPLELGGQVIGHNMVRRIDMSASPRFMETGEC